MGSLTRYAQVSNGKLEQAELTVDILKTLGMDSSGCLAAILVCVLAEVDSSALDVEKEFGGEVAALYHGVDSLNRLSSFSRSSEIVNNAEVNEDNLRKMLITMVDDVRVVLIKLADQLQLLRSARDMERDEQQHLSQLTLDVYAPLANRLGVWQLKWELEDFALRYKTPEVYRGLAQKLDGKRLDRENYIHKLIETIRLALSTDGIEAEVQGRPKHLYSIWKKMEMKGLSFENLWDIRAVRVVVGSVSECYSALGTIHTKWRHLPGEFDDYIATPKSNGYRSIHTVVIGPEDKTVEVQIRTREMHEDNELGVAAHWRYKERRNAEDNIDNKILWLRQLLEWKDELKDSHSISEAFKQSADSRRVYVFTPKGTVMDLPEGATPIDFAYAVHSEVGHRTRGARVNGKMVPLGYQLKTGEQVQIQTIKNGSPSRDWLRPELEYVKTQRARSRILQWFKLQDFSHHLAEGRTMLEKELSRLGLEDLGYERIVENTPYHKTDDLLAALGAGDYKLSRALLPFRRELEQSQQPLVENKVEQPKNKPGDFKVNGVGNLLTTMAKCCQPMPGEQIVGYITTGRGVSIHNRDCHNISGLDEELQNRLIEVEWGLDDVSSYPVSVRIVAYNRSGILHDITQVLKDRKVHVLKVNMSTDEENNVMVQLRLEVNGLNSLSKVLLQFSRIQNVQDVKRITN